MNIIEKAIVGSFESYGLAEGFDYDVVEGVAVFRSFMDSAAFNYAYSSSDVDDVVMNRVLEHFGNLPFSWFVKKNSLLTCFDDVGFGVYETLKGMSVNLRESSFESDIKVVVVDDFNHWSDVETKGFGLTEEYVRVFAKHLLSVKEQRFLVAYIGEEPASSVLVSLCGDVAYLAYVATVAEKRRLGAGTALVSYALRDALEHGCNVAVLHSSKMGESLYRRLGFEGDEDYIILRKKTSTSAIDEGRDCS